MQSGSGCYAFIESKGGSAQDIVATESDSNLLAAGAEKVPIKSFQDGRSCRKETLSLIKASRTQAGLRRTTNATLEQLVSKRDWILNF